MQRRCVNWLSKKYVPGKIFRSFFENETHYYITDMKNIKEELDKLYKDTLMHSLGIEFLDVSKDCVQGKMPVDKRTRRPFGFLHGGANSAFAESLASVGAALHINREREIVMGIEINANFIRSVKEGWVFGEACPLHVGSRTQLWNIRIVDEKKNLVCASRCTLLRVEKTRST